VGERADVERAAAAVGARHKALHLLVNNAGIPGRGGFLELTPERIEEVSRVNYLGSVWCLRSFLALLRRGAPADVVNVCSIAGTVPHGPSGPYSASKHAQLAFSRNVTAELAPHGIRVHSINPAFTETEGFPQDRLIGNGWARRLVMSPERVADAVLAALDHRKIETFVPGAYRAAAALAGIAPGSLTRLAARKANAR
jgi:short-subunit dehydrogenase